VMWSKRGAMALARAVKRECDPRGRSDARRQARAFTSAPSCMQTCSGPRSGPQGQAAAPQARQGRGYRSPDGQRTKTPTNRGYCSWPRKWVRKTPALRHYCSWARKCVEKDACTSGLLLLGSEMRGKRRVHFGVTALGLPNERKKTPALRGYRASLDFRVTLQ
jgi:hypothetical protein